MKQIILLAVCLSVNCTAFTQILQIEYEKVTEYAEDDKGRAIIPINDADYYRIRAKDGSSWGYVDRNGDIIIPLGKYKFLNPVDEYGMILAGKDGKEGFIDINENILIPFDYDDVGVFSKCVDLAPVIKDKKQGFINRNGDMVIPLEYDALAYVTYFYEPGEAILVKEGKYGVIDSKNNIIIPFEYDEIEWSDNKDSFIVSVGSDWTTFTFEGKQMSGYDDYEIVTGTPLGYLPSNSEDLPILVRREGNEQLRNELLFDIEYLNGSKKVRHFLETLTGGEFAYIDKAQNVIVPFGTYDHAEPFGLGRKAIVAKDGLYGIIDEYGKPVLPLEYEFVERPSQYSNYADIFVATKKDTVTIFDQYINIIPIGGIASYDSRWSDLIVGDRYGKMGLVSYTGKLTIPAIYDTLYHVRHAGYIALKDSVYGYISKENDIIKSFEYSNIYDLKNGLVFINADGKAGLFDKEGQKILPFDYEAIYDTWYNEYDPRKAKYLVIKDGKVGTVDVNNNVVIPIIYDGLSGWVEYGPEAHFVKKDGKYGLISHEGDMIIPIEYEYVGLPTRGVVIVCKNGKYGVVSLLNEVILPCIYDRVVDDIPFFDFEDAPNSKLVAIKDNEWHYFDLQGNLIREDVPASEIQKEYGYILEFGEPSDEYYDMKSVIKK